ncbi:hypothetical protein F4804DRAFT_158047 [Jackrogersella minutella]|nr:hypothetical protein F4804DRAFT_158047 [Jackrogersella minutella]
MDSTICNHCRTALRSSLRASRASQTRQPRTLSTTNIRRSSNSASQDLNITLAKPSWSVRSLLPSPGSETTTITPKTLHHLLRLSALPPPKSVEEESQMLSTLESQLQFVRAIREVDTTRVEPLRAIRDETTQGMHEQTIGLEQLKEALGKEDVVGHARRPRRRQREEERARKDMGGEEKETVYPEAEGWDVLAGASETAGRYFVVRTGSSGPTQTEQASRNTEHLKKT